jgi:redox-sensitive bicupin YhaK (pirin superfamily)
MMSIRRSSDRGFADHGWLKSFHTFSFADYHDPEHMGFGNLRVINEDRVAPGAGFGKHSHRDMEIVSYVLEGALAHSDSLGTGGKDSPNTGIVRPGDVQRMSAGTGVTHSEYNHSPDAEVHFLQIWILPSKKGITPSYEQRHFDEQSKSGRLRLVASPDGRDGSVKIHADASIRAGLLDGDDRVDITIHPSRHFYIHIGRGEVQVNGELLAAGDAAELSDEKRVSLHNARKAEVLLFDLA